MWLFFLLGAFMPIWGKGNKDLALYSLLMESQFSLYGSLFCAMLSLQPDSLHFCWSNCWQQWSYSSFILIWEGNWASCFLRFGGFAVARCPTAFEFLLTCNCFIFLTASSDTDFLGIWNMDVKTSHFQQPGWSSLKTANIQHDFRLRGIEAEMMWLKHAAR